MADNDIVVAFQGEPGAYSEQAIPAAFRFGGGHAALPQLRRDF